MATEPESRFPSREGMQPPCDPAGLRPTEHKIEFDSGWTFNRETGETTAWDGIRILWRFEGERRWRRLVLIPDEDLGQTVGSLVDQVPAVVESLAEKAS